MSLRGWTWACTLASGILALAWLLLRSGTKPSRLAYPCQRAAMGTAAAAFGGPLVAGLILARTRLLAGLHHWAGKSVLAAGVTLAGVLFTLARTPAPPDVTMLIPPANHHPVVFQVNHARGAEPLRHGGFDDLVTLMGLNAMPWHRSAVSGPTSGPGGLIDATDVVLIKINAQWPERGGTNTDLLRGVIRRICEHPDGFSGEIVVADNGQGWGSLNHAQSNADDPLQSAQDVVADFATEGWTISAQLWDSLRFVSVGEYQDGDMTSGYVVDALDDPETLMKVSYPKFQTAYGTYISYKHGLWVAGLQVYAPDRLVVINMPVLKTHFIYGVTGAVKNHMGVVTTRLSTDSHNAVGRGGMGSLLASVRLPDLTLLDCIWVLARPGRGPAAVYADASRRDQLLAGTDPIALDVWAVKHILMPQIIENGYTLADYGDTQDPDNPNSVFRQYLDRSMNEILAAGIDVTNDPNAVDVRVWGGDLDRDGDVDLTDLNAMTGCLAGPGAVPPSGPPDCTFTDFYQDGDVDLEDYAGLQNTFTGAF
ncbi:MAG: DUF362 domain-containing protein [Phycisphaerae bacterium]